MGVVICLVLGLFFRWSFPACVLGVIAGVLIGLTVLGPAGVLVALDIVGGLVAFLAGSALSSLVSSIRSRRLERSLPPGVPVRDLRTRSIRFSLGDDEDGAAN